MDGSALGPFDRPRGGSFASPAAWRGGFAAGMVRTGDVVGRSVDLGAIGPDLPPWHVGVVVGPDEVVHFGPGGVVRESVATFARGRVVHVMRRPPNPGRAVRCARRAVGSRGYRLGSNNCTTFVSRCLSGDEPPRRGNGR